MSQIEKKNQEFVKTNSHVLEDTTNQEFGYWKSLKDISSEDDYNRFLKQSEHNAVSYTHLTLPTIYSV